MGCCSARYQDTPWNSNSIGLVPGWITGLRKRNKEPTKSFHKHVDTQCRPEMGLQISGGRIAEPKRIGNRWANKTLHGHADSIAIDNSRKAETIQVSFKQWLDKENLVHPYSGILFGIKRNEIPIHVTMWMNLENMLSERNQTQKIVYCMTQLYGNIQNRQIHRDRKQINGYQGLGEGAREWLPSGYLVSSRADEEHCGNRQCRGFHSTVNALNGLNCALKHGLPILNVNFMWWPLSQF